MKVKKTLLCLLLCAFAFAALFAFTACSDKDPEDSNVASVAISPSTATLTVGEELDYSNFEITVTYEGDKEPEKIQLTAAMISEEDKQLLSEVGEHDITVSCKGKTTTLKVTVNPMEMNVTVSDASTIYTGEEVYPVVTGAPSGAKISYTIYQGESAVEANKVESAVDAGVYFVEVQVTAKNYTTVEETATINIAKAPFDTNELIWSNTGYLYTGEEVALAATVTGLPEGIELSGFTAEGTDQKSSASEKGYYTATANFTGENKNYVLVSCVINWRILESGSVALEPWFGAEDGELIVATFDSDTFTFGDTQTSYTVSYDENNGNATVTAEGYTSVTATDGVLRVEKAGKTYVLISESALARYEGEHSIYVEEFELVFDKAEGTATLVSKRLGEEAVTRNVTLSVKDGASADTAAFSVTGTDWVFTYNLSAGYLKLDGYKNPAAFDVISTDFYLPAKADVDAIFENITAGRFTEYTNSDLFEVTKENGNIAFTYNGVSVDPFCIIYYSSYYGASLKTYVVPDSSCASGSYNWKEITVYDSYYKLGYYLFIPEVYAEFFGYYYLQDGEGLHVSSATKISFMESSGYFRIIFNNANYDFDKGTLLLSAEGDTLTATLKKEGEADVTLTFTDGVSVSYDGASYLKIQTLLNTKGSYSGDSYYNGAGDELRYEVSSTSMKLTVGGVVASDFTLEKTANGKKITVVNEGKTFVIEWGDDVRYLTVNGELYVYGDMTSDSDGRTPSVSYVSGENTVQFTARQYILNETPLTNLTYALVDDGNGNGRTVLQATGYIEDTKYVILHYSQAAWIVNGSVYVPEYMENLFGSEYKQSPDSTETFRFDTDGKVKFRDQEIFPVMGNSLSAVKTFYYSENGRLYRFSLAINLTRIQIYGAPGYSDYFCYLSSYFDFKGAYISQDGTKAFYFDAGTVYYDETSNTTFSIMPTDTGALMTIGSSKLEAVFTKAANGSVTLVYDGVTYVPAEVDLSSLYGTYTAYDGSASGTSVVIKTNPGYSDYKISKFIIFNGEVTPVFNGNYGTNIYFIKNNDGATAAKLPYLAVVDKYAKLVSTETFNGKELSISVGVTTKPDSTELMPALVVTYNNESVALEKVDYQNYKAVLGGVEYYLRANDNAETKDLLPLLVFEGWWETYDGEYSLNGNTVVLEIAVGGSDSAPETVLNVTFNGAAINASFESVSGGYLMHFTYENVEYIGVLNTANVLDVTVYTQKEYDFFFAAGYSNAIGGKDLVLPVEFGYAYDNYYLGRVITFNLEEAKYGEEEITFAQPLK